jgi:hypothetical protein
MRRSSSYRSTSLIIERQVLIRKSPQCLPRRHGYRFVLEPPLILQLPEIVTEPGPKQQEINPPTSRVFIYQINIFYY